MLIISGSEHLNVVHTVREVSLRRELGKWIEGGGVEGATFIGKNALVMLSACSKLQHSKLVRYGLVSLSMVHKVTKQICVFEYIFLEKRYYSKRDSVKINFCRERYVL